MQTSFPRGIICPIGYEKRTKKRGCGKPPISGETWNQSKLRKGHCQIRQTMCLRMSSLVRLAKVPYVLRRIVYHFSLSQPAEFQIIKPRSHIWLSGFLPCLRFINRAAVGVLQAVFFNRAAWGRGAVLDLHAVNF